MLPRPDWTLHQHGSAVLVSGDEEVSPGSGIGQWHERVWKRCSGTGTGGEKPIKAAGPIPCGGQSPTATGLTDPPMSRCPRQIAVLGSTGSIGQSALDVIQGSAGRLKVLALSARHNLDRLVEQAQIHHPQWVVAADEQAAAAQNWEGLPEECELLVGQTALDTVAGAAEVDVVVSAIVGSAGMMSTWAAVSAGKTVALANKESLVMAGELIVGRAQETGALLLPVDSEHSAIFQALRCGRREEVRRIVLTASGGPFRQLSATELERVTVEEALAHPTWEMGPKITVDSATLMNKALEIVEARWLFGLSADEIAVMIHPQSIIHSLVEFVDGAVVAQMSPPDMRLPIQYALEYPHRQPAAADCLDWSRPLELALEPPDATRFPALDLGLEVARRGGTSGAVMNAANEEAVGRFLNGTLGFHEIVPACRRIVETHEFQPQPTLEEVCRLDTWAREEVSKWVCA